MQLVEMMKNQKLGDIANWCPTEIPASIMDPKGDEGDPASVTMHGFEVIVLDHSEARPCGSEDSEEHGENDVRHRDVSDVHVVVTIVDKVFDHNGGVENKPYDSCGTGATVCSSIVEDFSQSPGRQLWV